MKKTHWFFFLLFLTGFATGQESGVDGESVYLQWCALCHEGQVEKAPHVTSLRNMPADMFMASLTQGAMLLQAQLLTVEERDAVATYLVGSAEYDVVPEPVLECSATPLPVADRNEFIRWGNQLSNSRYIGPDETSISADQLEQLTPLWSFVYPKANRARSQPALAEGMVIAGSHDGTVYALDRETGCAYWTYRASTEVRTGISVDPDTVAFADRQLYFGDFLGRVYALKLSSGELVWKVSADPHPTTTITAQPQLHDGVLYVSVSSREFLAGASGDYPCCSFRGSVVALDTHSGEQIWQTFSIPDAPEQVGFNEKGVPRLAPSGAPIWNTAAIDPKRGLLYVGTGENYTRPTSDTSDAILAMRLDDGAVQWVRQTLSGDAWNVACNAGRKDSINCPQPRGPDLDFGAPPILVNLPDGDILVAGQKSGVVHGIDPDNGELLWQTRVGRGGGQGGIHFGMAVMNGVVYAGVNDFDFSDSEFPARPGLSALDARTGELLWYSPANDICGDWPDCSPGISAPVTATAEAIFAGHSDGRIRAYDPQSGEVLWEYQTKREWQSPDGRIGEGGSIGGGTGVVAIDGTLYVNSGYGTFKHMAGNVLIALTAPEVAKP
jgi:polyvinyl alcohol dehydrogenase (cytochrome)